MATNLSILILSTFLVVACEDSAKPGATRKEPSGQKGGETNGDNSSPSGDSTGSTNTGDGGGTGDQGKTGNSTQVDIIAIVAVGDENISQGSAEGAAIKNALAAIAKKYQGQDVKYALIGSSTATLSGVKVNLDPAAGFTSANSKQLNFELAPADSLLGALVAGCPANDSDLEATHASGNIKVCGQAVAVGAHSWTWGVQDLKGQLEGFLRKGSQRTYIFFSSNDATTVTAVQFQSIAKTQNNTKAPKVFSFVPKEKTGFCNDKTLAAPVIEQISTGNGGTAFSFCKADWSASISDLVNSLYSRVARGTPEALARFRSIVVRRAWR